MHTALCYAGRSLEKITWGAFPSFPPFLHPHHYTGVFLVLVAAKRFAIETPLLHGYLGRQSWLPASGKETTSKLGSSIGSIACKNWPARGRISRKLEHNHYDQSSEPIRCFFDSPLARGSKSSFNPLSLSLSPFERANG